jgi:hypothetical protein
MHLIPLHILLLCIYIFIQRESTFRQSTWVFYPTSIKHFIAISEPRRASKAALTRANSANVLDEGLRIGGRGRQMNSKVKIDKQGEVWRVLRISVVLNWLNLNLSMAGLSWPLYIGGQVSRNRPGSIQITMSVYDVISYFDYIYA